MNLVFSQSEESIFVNITVMKPQYSNNGSNSTTYTGDPILLYTKWDDNVNLSYAILSTNETGVWKNYTDNTYESPKTLSGLSDWSNFTWQNNSLVGTLIIAWKIYANDTEGYENVTSEMTFTAYGCSIAIGLSDILADGITFGSLNQGETGDATGNNGASETDYNITLQVSGCCCTPNTVDVYIKGASDLKSGSYVLDLSNEKFRNHTTDRTVPSSLQNISLTTNFADNNIGDDLANNGNISLKFILSVPSSQIGGYYNNTIQIWGGRSDLSPPP